MNCKKRILSVVAVVLCTAAAVVYGAGDVNPVGTMQPAQSTEGLFSNHKETIYFWYTDEDMTSFVNSAAVSFGEQRNVRVIPVLTSEGEYLEAINQATLHTDQMPDVYLMESSSLEKAYLAGLAGEISDAGEVCNTAYFPQAALYAVTYRDKKLAYPLYFETSALLYNKSYLEQWAEQQEARLEESEAENPEGSGQEEAMLSVEELDYLRKGNFDTLDDLLYVANTFDVPEGVEGIMRWDVSDIFYNYWFAGHYLVVGGTCGDDRSRIDLDNPEAIQCLKTYQTLNQFFSMETDTITYESVLQDLIDGKIMFTVATSDAIKHMEEAREKGECDFDYGFSMMPDITEELDSSSLAVTNCVVVNGYSASKELANAFATYLAQDCAEELFQRTGKVPARLNTDPDNEAVQTFKEEYRYSAALPKMMEAGNYWMQMEVLFAKIWNGEDVEYLMGALAEQMQTQLSTR
ncbi:MAG: extracellular solute-binding protein [Lachnospiraceae bacterium]|nr:extracellular solute-binding protein [Lachnospiraceae bacterium]